MLSLPARSGVIAALLSLPAMHTVAQPSLSPDGSTLSGVEVDGITYQVNFADARFGDTFSPVLVGQTSWESLANDISVAVVGALNGLATRPGPADINGCTSTTECILFLPDEYIPATDLFLDNSFARVRPAGASRSAGSADGTSNVSTFMSPVFTVMTFEEAGLPPGVLNVVTGEGPVVGQALGLSMGIDVLAFTGSGATGRRLLDYAARSNLKRCYLELGGKSPNVVFADAPDLAMAAKVAAAGIFRNAGQVCVAASRLLVEESIHDDFVAALVEANHYLQMAREALDALPESDEQKRLRLRVLTGLAAVKRGRLSIAHDDVGALGQETLSLARSLGDNRAEMLALNGLYAHALVRADYRSAHEWATALIAAAKAGQDRVFAMIGQRALGVVALHAGQFEAAETGLRAALDAYDRARDLRLAYAHGYDHAEICAVFLAFTLWMRGDLKGAREMSAFSVDHSRAIDHAHSLGQAQAFRAMLAAMALDAGELARAGDEALVTADRFDIKVARGAGLFFGSAARMLADDRPPDDARLRDLAAHFDAFREFNPYNYGPFARSLLAMAQLRAGRLDEAGQALDIAREVAARTGETWTNTELDRLAAQLARARGDGGEADRIALRAYEQAEAGGAVTLALRLACDLVEANGAEEDFRRLATAAGRIVSDDDGWDMCRYRALAAASAGTRASSASR